MILQVLCVRDRAADVFGTPFFSAAVGSAVRSFSDELNSKDGKSQLAAHPEDFDLYYLGTYDDSRAEFFCKDPRQVAIGKDLVRG